MKASHIVAASSLLVPLLGHQSPQVLDAAALRSMVEGLGYTVKAIKSDPGKEKFEFTVTTEKLNIPVATEISPSTNYVWLTVNLGTAPKSADVHTALLKLNADIQPDFFYITKAGLLMLGVGVDNRSITPAIMKRIVKKLCDDVESSKSTWSPS